MKVLHNIFIFGSKRPPRLLSPPISSIILTPILLTNRPRTPNQRIRKDASNGNRLMHSEFGSMALKVQHGGGFDAEDAFAGLCYVEVDLHYPLFTP